jgi:phosphatidylinositol alpha-1,6-mannosyltransferase
MPYSPPVQKVLFVFTQVFANGGIQRFNKTMLDACDRLGVRCRVLSLNDSPAAIDQDPRYKSHSIAGFAGNRPRFALALAGELLRNRYDRVLIGHINFLALFIVIRTLLRSHITRTMMVAHGIEVWSGIGGMRRHALHNIDRILCVSHYTRRRILEQTPALDEDKLLIFPNALADSWRRVTAVPFPGFLPARFILSVTRLEPGDRHKGIATVIEAFSRLTDDSMHYFVVGEGSDLSFLESVAVRFGVDERVHFMRGVSDSELVSLYQKCEAFVLPSGKEGFGIVFLEAMFFGAPVIAAQEKGAVDVVKHDETGLTVPFGDTLAIKQAIERMGADPQLRERLRANGLALVCDGGPFTFARFTQRWADILDVGEPSAA